MHIFIYQYQMTMTFTLFKAQNNSKVHLNFNLHADSVKAICLEHWRATLPHPLTPQKKLETENKSVDTFGQTSSPSCGRQSAADRSQWPRGRPLQWSPPYQLYPRRNHPRWWLYLFLWV